MPDLRPVHAAVPAALVTIVSTPTGVVVGPIGKFTSRRGSWHSFNGPGLGGDRTDTVNQTTDAERTVATAIGFGRIIWGATTALAPARVHRVLGVDYPGPDRGIWIKAFGVRDIVFGAAALHPDQTVGRLVLRVGIAMDLVDAGVVIAAARNGVPRRAAGVGVLLAGGTAVVAAIGPSLLRQIGTGQILLSQLTRRNLILGFN